MTQPFGDIPLFRELQRLLSSSQGPVNLEIARQIAGTVATQAPDPTPPAETTRGLAEGVREAEVVLSGYTRLSLDEPMSSTTMGRATWVLRALDGWRWLLEGTARRFADAMSALGGSEDPATNPVAQMMGQIGPLLLGIQTGTVVGNLALDALARHDPPIPLDDDGRLFFVTPNIARVAEEYDFELAVFHRWLALQEASRHLLIASTPWTGKYLRSLLVALIDSIEIDGSDMERRLLDLQSGGPEALQSGAAMDQLIPIAATERHDKALANLRSFLAVFEGYTENAAAAVKPSLLGDVSRIDEGMARHRATPSEGKAMLASVLGIERDRGLENAGQTFCAAVIKLRGVAALNRVWAAPDNLPTLEEIKDPFAWMERVLDSPE